MDEQHISRGFHQLPQNGQNMNFRPNANDNNSEDQWKNDTLLTKNSHDSNSIHDTSSEVIDIDEAIGVSKVSFLLPNDTEIESRPTTHGILRTPKDEYFDRGRWVGTSPFHNRDNQPNRPQSPSKHQYQEIGEGLTKKFHFGNTNNQIEENGQWSSNDEKTIDEISSDFSSSISRLHSPMSPVRQTIVTDTEIKPMKTPDLKKLNIQQASDFNSNQISYGYENVLPLSKLPISPGGSSTAPSSVFSTTSEEDEFDLDSQLGPNSKFKRRVKTEQKDMPLVVFPKRKKSSSRSFQFSLPTKRFQRVLDTDPRNFFSRSMSSLQGGNSNEQSTQQSHTRSQRGRNLGNYRNKNNRSTPSKVEPRSRTHHPDEDKNSIDITFDEKDEDEYMRNKNGNSSLQNLSNLTESYIYEKTLSSTKKVTETRI
jgi:hypothetical protein